MENSEEENFDWPDGGLWGPRFLPLVAIHPTEPIVQNTGIHAFVRDGILVISGPAGAASLLRSIAFQRPEFLIARFGLLFLNLAVTQELAMVGLFRRAAPITLSTTSHVSIWRDRLRSGFVLGLVQALALSLLWNGATLGLHDRWIRNDGTKEPHLVLISRLISGSLFGLVQPFVHDTLLSAVHAVCGTIEFDPAISRNGSRRQAGWWRRFANAELGDSLNGVMTVGSGLCFGFSIIHRVSLPHILACVVIGHSTGFFLYSIVKDTLAHWLGDMGAIVSVPVHGNTLRDLGSCFRAGLRRRLRGHLNLGSFIGNPFAKGLAVTTFLHIGDLFEPVLRGLFATDDLQRLVGWKAGAMIFLINSLFFIWASNVIGLCALFGGFVQRTLLPSSQTP